MSITDGVFPIDESGNVAPPPDAPWLTVENLTKAMKELGPNRGTPLQARPAVMACLEGKPIYIDMTFDKVNGNPPEYRIRVYATGRIDSNMHTNDLIDLNEILTKIRSAS